MITLVEYNRDSKATGRICRMPNVTRVQLAELLPLYGFTGTCDVGYGLMDGYSSDRWCFVYQSLLDWHSGINVDLSDLLDNSVNS